MSQRNNNDMTQRDGFIDARLCVEEEEGLRGGRSSLVAREDDSDASSSSSLGTNIDISGDSADEEESREGQLRSLVKGAFNSFDDSKEVFSMRSSISKVYSGKSKSFTSLADAVAASSIKEFAKLEDPYAGRCKNLQAHSTFLAKNQSRPVRNNDSEIPKRLLANSGGRLVALIAPISRFESGNSRDFHAISSHYCHPPLHPQYRKPSNNIGPSSSPQRWIEPSRFFSLSGLHCVAVATPIKS